MKICRTLFLSNTFSLDRLCWYNCLPPLHPPKPFSIENPLCPSKKIAQDALSISIYHFCTSHNLKMTPVMVSPFQIGCILSIWENIANLKQTINTGSRIPMGKNRSLGKIIYDVARLLTYYDSLLSSKQWSCNTIFMRILKTIRIYWLLCHF